MSLLKLCVIKQPILFNNHNKDPFIKLGKGWNSARWQLLTPGCFWSMAQPYHEPHYAREVVQTCPEDYNQCWKHVQQMKQAALGAQWIWYVFVHHLLVNKSNINSVLVIFHPVRAKPFVQLDVSGNFYFYHQCTSGRTKTAIIYHAVHNVWNIRAIGRYNEAIQNCSLHWNTHNDTFVKYVLNAPAVFVVATKKSRRHVINRT